MEESVNFVKGGYGKINPSEDETTTTKTHFYHQQTVRNRRRIAIGVSLGVTLTLIIAATIGALIVHESVTEPSESEEELSAARASIRTVCSVTRYPDACFSNISSINTDPHPDPESILVLSLRLTAGELANISSLPKQLISRSNDLKTGPALRDCASLFEDASSQLEKSVAAMGVGEKMLTGEKIGDLKTWISAAMTDQETCLDGLQEMGSTAVDEVRVKVQRSTEYMSNSLAILNSIPTLLEKFGIKMH